MIGSLTGARPGRYPGADGLLATLARSSCLSELLVTWMRCHGAAPSRVPAHGRYPRAGCLGLSAAYAQPGSVLTCAAAP